MSCDTLVTPRRRIESQRNRRCGARLFAVSRTATTTREAAVEILALNVFGIADRTGQPVTRRLAEQRLAELAGHADACGCGLCDLVPPAAVRKGWWTASRWQPSIAPTRGRARPQDSFSPRLRGTLGRA